MKRSVEDTSIAMIGAGNLATNLAKAFYRKGYRIVQVCSRTMASAQALAEKVESAAINDLSQLHTHANMYVVALPDDAAAELIPRLVKGREKSLWVHTGGSMPMSVFEGTGLTRYGVLYPLQTLSKEREVNFRDIPLFYESNNEDDARLLKAIALTLSRQVIYANSEQRLHLHLAAVYTNNFANHMYALAADLLQQTGLPFEVLLPLIDETAAKVHDMSPRLAQTGPAVRMDEKVIAKHLSLLEGEDMKKKIYQLLTKSIHQTQQ